MSHRLADEGKPGTRIQEEIRDMFDHRTFDFPFLRLFGQTEKIEAIGILQRFPAS